MGNSLQSLTWKVFFGALGLLIVPISLHSQALHAASPFNISYSGRLVDTLGRPISGPITLTLKFYDSAEDGNLKGRPIAFRDVALDAGVFSVSISLAESAYNTYFGLSGNTWIEAIDVTHNVTYPRQQFFAVPYALKVPVDNSSIGYDSSGKLKVLGLGGNTLPTTNPTVGQIFKLEQWLSRVS